MCVGGDECVETHIHGDAHTRRRTYTEYGRREGYYTLAPRPLTYTHDARPLPTHMVGGEWDRDLSSRLMLSRLMLSRLMLSRLMTETSRLDSCCAPFVMPWHDGGRAA